MFTGLVTDVGRIVGVRPGNDLVRFSVASAYPAETIPIGASIACAGICLTAVAVEPNGEGSVFDVEEAPETLALTTAAGRDGRPPRQRACRRAGGDSHP
jgi:riboflavin synthase